MKPQELKQKFIELRADGHSYSTITKELGIAKGTCSKWERELEDEIATLKRESLTALYDSYHMTKEARIKKLGDTLSNIDEALAKADLSEVPADKLLDYKLKYMEALRKEYTPAGKPLGKDINQHTILTAMGDLLDRVRAGEITPEQATRESTVLANLLKAYDTVEVQAKLKELEAIVGSNA
jgi:hypothetical protein